MGCSFAGFFAVASALYLVSAPRRTALEVAKVSRGQVVNVESASNVELACRVGGGTTILWILPDGTQVQAGDELV